MSQQPMKVGKPNTKKILIIVGVVLLTGLCSFLMTAWQFVTTESQDPMGLFLTCVKPFAFVGAIYLFYVLIKRLMKGLDNAAEEAREEEAEKLYQADELTSRRQVTLLAALILHNDQTGRLTVEEALSEAKGLYNQVLMVQDEDSLIEVFAKK